MARVYGTRRHHQTIKTARPVPAFLHLVQLTALSLLLYSGLKAREHVERQGGVVYRR